MANFAEASALPHGSVKPQKLKAGDIVLMDCGCSVHGYSSDISRTIVFGAEPTKRQLDIWNLENNRRLQALLQQSLDRRVKMLMRLPEKY